MDPEADSPAVRNQDRELVAGGGQRPSGSQTDSDADGYGYGPKRRDARTGTCSFLAL